MELDKLNLSPYTIKNLYPRSIINTKNENEAKTAPFKFLGACEQKIIIIISSKKVTFLSDSELAFLTKILTACKLTLADVAIININNFTKDQFTSVHDMEPVNVIMFGVSCLEFNLPFDIPNFQVQPYAGVKYLTAPLLNEIENDQQLKKSLWSCFQKMLEL